jgi:DNA replication and repair protein RecF
LQRVGEAHQIGVGFDGGENGKAERRQIRIDGENATSTELRNLLGVQWLTPRMDRLFMEGKGERRRFLDRLVFGSDPDHGKRVNTYEGVMRERNQLLRDKRRDDAWLGALEARMAEDAVAIAAARLATLDRLNAALVQGIGPFPSATLTVDGVVEALLLDMPAVEAEGRFAELLRSGRYKDEAAGRALEGPHRSDLLVTYAANGLPAAQCSTGEQKALLIAIVLANARLEKVEQGHAPILLMDEVTAHLDEHRRRALFDEICALSGQTWLTGTDRELFAGLEDRAQFYKVQDSALYLEE